MLSWLLPAGVTLLLPGSTNCDPYDQYAGSCWGAAPICSFANQCIGIPYYNYGWGLANDNYWDNGGYWDDGWGGGWGFFR